MNIEPIGERVLLEQSKKEEKTAGGIYIPSDAREEKKEGTIIAVGTFKDGKPLPLQQGDKVIYGGYSHEELEIKGKKYVLVELKDLVAKIRGD